MNNACPIDTNVLLYLANPQAPEHARAKAAVADLLANDQRPIIAAQIVFEFWSVATRPTEANGLGWSTKQAFEQIEIFRTRFGLLYESPAVVDLWLHVVVSHGRKGKRIQDAHLLATMKANGVDRLLRSTRRIFLPTRASPSCQLTCFTLHEPGVIESWA